MEDIWFTPDTLKTRIRNHLLLWTLMPTGSEREGDDPVLEDLKRRMLHGERIHPADHPELNFTFRKRDFRRVGDRVKYAKALENDPSLYIAHPIIDKTEDLIFDVGTHGAFMNFFYAAHIGEFLGPPGYEDKYILEGHGYFQSTVNRRGFMIGKELFRRDALDEYDEIIIGTRGIHIVDSIDDIKNLRY